MSSSRDDPSDAGRNPWQGVELRHLAALAAVARAGSFRAAATELGYVQSAVSQQVAHVEKMVGYRLIDRDRRGGPAVLTAAGTLLLEHAERILSSFATAKADLDGLADGPGPPIRLGVCDSLAPGLLPRVTPVLVAERQSERIEVAEAPGTDLATRVAYGTLDAALVEGPGPHGPFSRRDLGADEYVLLSPSDRAVEPARLQQLTELPLIDHPWMTTVENGLVAAGIVPRYAAGCRASSRGAITALVAAGAGCALLPDLALEPTAEDITLIPLGRLLEPRRVCLLTHADRASGSWLEPLAAAATA